MKNSGLNPEQMEAVGHNYGPLLILAGAGSGKTTVLVARTGRLIEEQLAKASQILVLTFTNKSARELKHRVSVKLGDSAKGLWAGTFHSFGLSLLRANHKEVGLPAQFGVLDSSDCESLIREIMKDVKIAGKDKFDLSTILEIINRRRAKGRAQTEGFDEYHEMAEVIYPKFMRKLEVLGAVDFEALLLKPVELLQQNPKVLAKIQERYQHVMVDEFQDTNQVQMKFIDQIVNQHRNITVVGDDDQSIYGWRGAEVQNILNFPNIYKPCKVIRLERNYRSTPAILNVANGVIAKNKHRHDKVLKAEGAANHGERPELFVLENENEESDYVLREIRSMQLAGASFSDFAVLYRSNAQGGLIESRLRQEHIPYNVSGGTGFFDRKEIKDVLAYLRLALHPHEVALRRIINVPARGIGDTSVERLNQWASERNISFLLACQQWRQAGVPEKAGNSIDALLKMSAELAEKLVSHAQPGTQLIQILREMGYRDYLYQNSASNESGEKRWILVESFSRILDSFAAKGGSSLKTLREFVDAMELRDEPDEADKAAVSLMTLHAAKGLEFPFVFLLGVEEDLLPHKSLGGNVDEERRLFYVGLTRAKKELFLSRCKFRTRYGDMKPVSPSRFLLEIPKESLRIYENGVRPVTGAQRDSLVANFMSELGSRKRI